MASVSGSESMDDARARVRRRSIARHSIAQISVAVLLYAHISHAQAVMEAGTGSNSRPLRAGLAKRPVPAQGPAAGGRQVSLQGPMREGKLDGGLMRSSGDIRRFELVQSFSGKAQGVSFRTNRWGMRDREYIQTHPANTYRLALIGASYEMAAGVPMEEGFEWLTEDRLNREGPGAPKRRYEILNFAVLGYGLIQNVAVAESKVFQFEPDAVLYAINPIETNRVASTLVSVVHAGIAIPWPFVAEKLREAGVDKNMEEPELRRRIQPFAETFVRWGYARIVELCRERHVQCLALLVPSTSYDFNPARFTRLASAAADAGFKVVDLRSAFSGQFPDSIRLSASDAHPNARGHRLLSDRLYGLLREDLLKGASSRERK